MNGTFRSQWALAMPAALSVLEQVRLISEGERGVVERAVSPQFGMARWIAIAGGFHLHIKVNDAGRLPRGWLEQAGWSVVFERPGFVVMDAGGGVSVSFSSIPVAAEEAKGAGGNSATGRPKPYVDHIGIDFPERMPVREVLDPIREMASGLGWPVVGQGGAAGPVACCYAIVVEKLWVYPTSGESPGIALEFSAGRQVEAPDRMGEDLRPSDPGSAIRGIGIDRARR